MKALGAASALMSANTALGNLTSEDPKKAGVNASLSIGSSRSTNTTTTSGVSGIAGDKEVRTGDGSGGLVKTFDADKVNKEVGAQLQITSTFGQQATKALGDSANGKAKELRA